MVLQVFLLFFQYNSILTQHVNINDELFSKLENYDKKIAQMEDNYEKRMFQMEEEIEERVAKLEELARIGTLRSCAEYSRFGLKSSGMYNIDPDGPLLGSEPFQVFCNFETGATEVLHDSENLTVVNHCHDPGNITDN